MIFLTRTTLTSSNIILIYECFHYDHADEISDHIKNILSNDFQANSDTNQE